LAKGLAAQGCRCMLVDWPGFGDSTRGRLRYGPQLYHHLPISRPLSCRGERRSLQPDMLPPTRVCLRVLGRACGRAPCCWRLPGGDRSRPRWVSIHELTHGSGGLVGTPVVGEALYRLNTLRCVIGLMYRRHVYSDVGRITPAFIAKKRDVARRPGARFGSVALVTGNLDPVSDHSAVLALFDRPPVPTLVPCGNATRDRNRKWRYSPGNPGSICAGCRARLACTRTR
jgi:hypothetical protein